jgi:hypothetical protein
VDAPKAPPAVTNELLFGLINSLLPDQPGHLVRPGPDGEVWFNPQPDPPVNVRQQDPWRAVAAARNMISTASVAMVAEANQEEGLVRARAILKAMLEDFVGKGTSRIPLPPPWPRVDLRPNALDIVIAAAQFHSAATAMKEHPLRKDIAASAEHLLQAALQRLAR